MSALPRLSMPRRRDFCALAAACLPILGAQAAELTGRFSVLGSVASAGRGQSGHAGDGHRTLTADQQSLRLMLDHAGERSQWSAHLRVARQRVDGMGGEARHSSALFRTRPIAGDWWSQGEADKSTRVGYELDRAVYKHRFDTVTLGIGRQPIDWGSGRLWQPLNVFGAFAPTDLDTDFKPGIDAAVLDWYPSAFSSVTAAYALAPHDEGEVDNSAALHYRRQVGATAEMALLLGRVIGNRVAGASFESDWRGMGWRIEGLHSRLDEDGEHANFWIAGIDYQFSDGTTVVAEWYRNSRGADDAASLAGVATDRLVAFGLQPHLGGQVLGIGLDRDFTPLLRGGYTFLASALDNGSSLLHQLNLVYSVSNESDLLFSVTYAAGERLDAQGVPQSEFGHLPTSATLRFRVYF